MAMGVIEDRRSIRKYKSDTIPQEVLEQILEAGRLVPSGKNKQPWKFVVFGGKEKEKLLQQMENGILREKTGTVLC